jgi:hypothetical protein
MQLNQVTPNNEIMRRLDFTWMVFLLFSGMIAFPNDIEQVKEFLSREPCVGWLEFEHVDFKTGQLVHRYQARVCGTNYVLLNASLGGSMAIPVSETNRNRAPLFTGRKEDERWQISGYQISRSVNPDCQRSIQTDPPRVE